MRGCCREVQIGVTSADDVAAFIKKRGPKLKYTFAYSDERTTYDAWVTAAGKSGVPLAVAKTRSPAPVSIEPEWCKASAFDRSSLIGMTRQLLRVFGEPK